MLSSRLGADLAALSRREGVSFFILLLAAFQTLLHRYTGENDITVGTPILNRSRVELESVIGFLAIPSRCVQTFPAIPGFSSC